MKDTPMQYEDIEKIALSFNGATKECKASWDNALVFWIDKKIFLLVIKNRDKMVMNFKNDEFINEHLRESYEDITPAYHMNKKHWNSLYYENSSISKEFLKQLIFESCEIVLKSLPKRIQEQYLYS